MFQICIFEYSFYLSTIITFFGFLINVVFLVSHNLFFHFLLNNFTLFSYHIDLLISTDSLIVRR